jgi:hypothetical protein
MRVKVKQADIQRMRKSPEIPKHMQLKTPAHAKHHLLSSIHLAMKQPTKSAMKLLISQQLLAERWEVKMITSMRKRRKTYLIFSFGMHATESIQMNSMEWFRRHILLLESKMKEIERRADESESAVVNVQCVESE